MQLDELFILQLVADQTLSPEEAKARLSKSKKARGRPKKPRSTFICYSEVTDPETGNITRHKAHEPKAISDRVKRIGGKYVELRDAGKSEREAMSIVQREFKKPRSKECYSEIYIHKCRVDYLLWRNFSHMIRA